METFFWQQKPITGCKISCFYVIVIETFKLLTLGIFEITGQNITVSVPSPLQLVCYGINTNTENRI